jgi:Ras-related protein Rab-2A
MAEYVFKVIILGETSVGKSSICNRYVENKFEKNYDMTIGVEFASKILNIKGHSIKLQLWDTAGQEQFKSIVKSYYRNTAGALLCFDLTNRKSFEALSSWISEIKYYSEHAQIILVGTKIDMIDSKLVSTEEAREFANKYFMDYIEVSSLTNDNISQVFESLTTSIYNHIMRYPYLIRDNINETGIKKQKDNDTSLLISEKDNKSFCCQIL